MAVTGTFTVNEANGALAAALLFSGSGADTLNGEAGSDVQIGEALSMCSMAA